MIGSDLPLSEYVFGPKNPVLEFASLHLILVTSSQLAITITTKLSGHESLSLYSVFPRETPEDLDLKSSDDDEVSMNEL